ncbi:DNA polymerase III, alpha subunit [uncultured Desulfatiglans sp.]|nr:DNA polymerase III, alpha subunit [uncultured Desulfatiglans sp.]
MEDFVHLHVHSHFSKGWGIGGVERLCSAAAALGMRRLALTDTNGLYGLVPFLQAAREHGITPIAGSELVHGGRRAVLLVKDEAGYANLSAVISARHCDPDFDLIGVLRDRRRGLTVLSDDIRLLKALRRDSRDDLFVEMSPGYGMARAYAFARRSGLPPVATSRVFLVERGDFPLHRILRAIAENSTLSRLEPADVCREADFLQPPPAMIDQFPHAPAAVANTLRVADGCLTAWEFNRIVFPRFAGMGDREAFDRLYQAALEGCRRRCGPLTEAVRRRLDHEMEIIRAKNFAHYFLVVAEMTRKVRYSCGRGSAAASLVAYALGITHVDPVRHNLLFERFLNPGRLDPPDIDVDFAWDEREQVMDEAFARYGHRRAAMVANQNTFGARAAVREVAKVFGLTEGEIARVTGRIGYGWRLGKMGAELRMHPRMRGLDFKEPWGAILDAAVKLEGHFNHLSTHCGGMVVVPDDIRRYCPVEISAKGVPVLQWEKDAVEDAGLVKIDILGNRSLAVIRDALAMASENHPGRVPAYDELDPLDDPAAVRIFHRADTFGVFYFESPATRRVLTQVSRGVDFEAYRRMDHFHLNVVVTSIIRPASNQSIHTWVERLHGAPWEPPHPLLRPVLEETLGVMVFQEQLSLAAVHLAGFEAGEADTLRKVVSKKHREKRLKDFYARFCAGAARRGVGRETVEDVWRMMMGFDGYSFCKPHSASYTLVAYKSAWLRARYPAEFMAAVISNGGGYYNTFGYISEARRMGLRVLPPDIDASASAYTGVGRDVRVGLMQLKALSAEGAAAILEERGKNGPFGSFESFLGRMRGRITLQDARILIKAGCFDRLEGEAARPALVWQALGFFARDRSRRCPGLFDCPDPAPMRPPGRGEPLCRADRLRQESETLGFYVSVHPIACYRDALVRLRPAWARDLRRCVGREVTAVGWWVTGKTVHTRGGEAMKFVSFEDPTGIYEAVFFPRVYDRYCHLLEAARPYVLKGRVEDDGGALSLNVRWIGFLDKYTGCGRPQEAGAAQGSAGGA